MSSTGGTKGFSIPIISDSKLNPFNFEMSIVTLTKDQMIDLKLQNKNGIW